MTPTPTDTRADLPSPPADASQFLEPTAQESAPLTAFERWCVRFVRRMNMGAWKSFWGFWQRIIGATWIRLATYNLLRVHGIEQIRNSDVARPLLLVANHRSFFDMYVVSSVLFRQARRPIKIFFPVRAELFYDSPLGMFVNLVMGWWSMFPPFFKREEKREFDKFSMRQLVALCRAGRAHVIGFHPEGKRNFSPDPYDLLRAQPGIGVIIKQAEPQVIPVFVTGLGNDLPKQILGNWRGGEKIRVHFGAPLDLTEFYALKNSARTYKYIGDFVMQKIAELAEQDRALYDKPDKGEVKK